MKKVVFVIMLAGLLVGCDGRGPTVKLKSDEGLNVNVNSGQALSVKVVPENEEPLPIHIEPDRISVGALVAFLIAVIAAIGAAFAAWRAASNTRHTAQAQLRFELIHKYNSKEMYDALKQLWIWDRNIVGQDKTNREDKAWDVLNNDELAAARKLVTNYYLNVLQLKKSKYLTEDGARLIFRTVGVEILDVLEPLEMTLIKKINEYNQQKINKEIKRLQKDFDEIRELAG